MEIKNYFEILDGFLKSTGKLNDEILKLIKDIFIDKIYEIGLDMKGRYVYINSEFFSFDFIETVDFNKKYSFEEFYDMYFDFFRANPST